MNRLLFVCLTESTTSSSPSPTHARRFQSKEDASSGTRSPRARSPIIKSPIQTSPETRSSRIKSDSSRQRDRSHRVRVTSPTNYLSSPTRSESSKSAARSTAESAKASEKQDGFQPQSILKQRRRLIDNHVRVPSKYDHSADRSDQPPLGLNYDYSNYDEDTEARMAQLHQQQQ